MGRTTTVAGTSIAFVAIGAAGFLLSAVYRLLEDYSEIGRGLGI